MHLQFSTRKHTHFFSILLMLHIFTIPSSLIFKLNLGAQQFSLSYIFLLAEIVYFAVMYLLIGLSKKVSPIEVLCIFSLFSYSISSIWNGFDIQFFLNLSVCVFGILCFSQIEIDYDLFEKYIIYSGVITAFIGLVLYVFNIPLFDFKYAGSESYFLGDNGYYRAMSIFMNPNSFAYYLIPSFIFVFFYKKIYIKLIVLGIIIAAFWLCDSRSATMGFLLMSVFWVLGFFVQRKILNRLFQVFVFLFFMFLLVSLDYLITLNYDIRFLKWWSAFNFISRDFFQFFFGVYVSDSVGWRNVTFSDNTFIFLLIKGGLFLLVPFIIILIYSWKYSFMVLENRILMPVKQLKLALYLISLIFPIFFSTLIMFHPISSLMGIFMGIFFFEIAAKKNIQSNVCNRIPR